MGSINDGVTSERLTSEELLNELNKTQLLEIAEKYSVKLKKGYKKDKINEAIINNIPEHGRNRILEIVNQKRCLIPISPRRLLFITILRNINKVNEIMRFLYPKYRRNRLTAQRAGGGYNDQSNYC